MCSYDDALDWLEGCDNEEAKVCLELIKNIQADADAVEDFYIRALEQRNLITRTLQ